MSNLEELEEEDDDKIVLRIYDLCEQLKAISQMEASGSRIEEKEYEMEDDYQLDREKEEEK